MWFSVDPPWIGEVKISAEMEEQTDGSFEITVTLDAELAAELGLPYVGEGEISASGKVTITLRFATKKEAEEFLADLQRAIKPDVGDWDFWRSGGKDWFDDLGDFFDEYADNLHTPVVTTGVGIAVDTIWAELAVSFEREPDPENGTVKWTAKLEATLDVNGLETEAAVSLQLVTDASGEVIEVELKFELEVTADLQLSALGFLGLPEGYSAESGARITVTIEGDPNDPALQQAIDEAISDDGIIDPGELQEIGEHADVTVTVSTVAEERGDTGGVEVKSKETTPVLIVHRGPGEDWEELELP